MGELQPYQQRAIDEKVELDSKRAALGSFMLGPVFERLERDEQDDLIEQHGLMTAYSLTLARRIARF